MVVLGLDKLEHFAHNVKNKASNEVHKIEHNVSAGIKKSRSRNEKKLELG